MSDIQSLQADAALMQTRQTPTVRKGSYTPEQARKVSQEFESVFLGQMLKPMFEGTAASAPFGGGESEEMWKSLQIDEYGKALSKNGGIGLADAMYGQIMRAQEGR